MDHAVTIDSAVARSDTAPAVVVARDTVPAKLVHGTVSGWVRTEDGVPIAGARVRLFGSEVVTETNNEGAFELTGVPAGTQTLMTRAIGFVPDERAVDLTDRHIPVVVGLLAIRRFLDTVHVKADRSTFMSAVGFEDRKKGGAGRFFTTKDVERLQPAEISDLLRHAPSLELSTDNAHNVKIRMRGDTGPCTPAIFLDGKQLVYWTLADLNSLVQPDELVGMEVYTPSMTPAEFRTKVGCGTIVVWTRPPSGSAASADAAAVRLRPPPPEEVGRYAGEENEHADPRRARVPRDGVERERPERDHEQRRRPRMSRHAESPLPGAADRAVGAREAPPRQAEEDGIERDDVVENLLISPESAITDAHTP